MNKILLIITVLLFLITNANHIIADKSISINSEIIYVDDDNINGPWFGTLENPYNQIIDALENATNGDAIYVFDGVYLENIEIEKRVSIMGEKQTIIDGDYNNFVIKIKSDSCVIKDLIIRNSGGYNQDSGILVESENNLIIGCEFYRTRIGLKINSDKNEIKNSIFHTNGNGILVEEIHNCSINKSSFYHNAIGLNIEKSNNIDITKCNFQANGISCLLNESQNIQIQHCNICNNSANLGGIFTYKSKNILIESNFFYHNGAGIHIFSSENIIIKNSDFLKNTHFAIAIRSISKSINIMKCRIKNNYRYGIYLEKNNICNITENNINQNYLYSIFSKSNKCIARKNYFGRLLGPTMTDTGKGARINLLVINIKNISWEIKPIIDAGLDHLNHEFDKIIIPIFSEKQKFKLSGEDNDNDGLPDWWETKYGYNPFLFDDHWSIDEDGDGLNNFEECYTYDYNSSPYKKDIFFEIDWKKNSESSQTNKPPEEQINRLIEIFKKHDITLHIDIGDLGGGEEIPSYDSVFSFSKLIDLYWNYFLHNDINNPRKGIFHYGVVCNYCPDLNFPFIGWDHLDSFAISSEWLQELYPQKTRGQLIVGAAVHHLGHSLGLLADKYDGIDNVGTAKIFSKQWFKFNNYKSCMNYNYKFNMFSYSDGANGRNDFNDWENLQFDFFKNCSFH